MFGQGCVAWTLEPLAYTGLGSAEFCHPKLDLIPKITPYPRVTIFHKLQRLTLSLLLQ